MTPLGSVESKSLGEFCPICAEIVAAALQAFDPSRVLDSLETIERRHIICVLTACDWHKFKAAKILGIERSTLDRKLRKWEIRRPAAHRFQEAAPC